MNKKLVKQLLILLAIFIALALILSNFNQLPANQDTQNIPFNQLIALIEKKEVDKIVIKPDQELKITLKDGKSLKTKNLEGSSLINTLKDYGLEPSQIKPIDINVEPENKWVGFISILFPIILPFLLLGGILYLFYRQARGLSSKTLSFGSVPGKQLNFKKNSKKNSNQNDDKKTTFKDVAGVEESKEELIEVIQFLKNPKKFTNLGARIPRGVILVGPPGCGKTLLAKAVAGEAEVPFFHISGSEFMEMFVGVGASRVRSLFQKAKRNAPCIIFIDELDSIGRKRGSGFGGAHDERDQTLNQILVEMDGFDTEDNIIVMAATNRPDILDPAILRPGRFDRRVTLELPDIKAREKILKVHSKNKPLDKKVNLRRIAERTPGFSGADLANLMNESAILTAKRNKKKISMKELLPSIEKVLLGPERKSKILSKKEKKITAYHEAGHAIVTHLLPNTDPVHKISIIARGQAGGYTLKVPDKDKHLHTRSEFLDDLAVSMGGLAAENFKFKEMTTGASGDLQQATETAKKIVTRYGMSKIGPIVFDTQPDNNNHYPWEKTNSNHSDKTLNIIDEEVANLLKKAYNKAEEIIKKNKSKLNLIAEKLLKQETIEKEEFEIVMQQEKT